jgi:hypothetical protein
MRARTAAVIVLALVDVALRVTSSHVWRTRSVAVVLE